VVVGVDAHKRTHTLVAVDEAGRKLTDTPIHRRALVGLVADLNAIGATYPGTDIPVIYRVRRPRRLSGVHRSQAVA